MTYNDKLKELLQHYVEAVEALKSVVDLAAVIITENPRESPLL